MYKACKIGKNTTHFKIRTGEIRDIKTKITCQMDHIIYVIDCPCGKQYVVSTTCKLQKRILEHIRAVEHCDRTYAVAKHMEKTHNGHWRTLQYFGIENITNGTASKYLRKHFLKIL